MARLQTRIVFLCLLTAFASSAFAQTANDETVFQDLHRKFSDPTASTCNRDPDCTINTYIAPWEQFLRTYPNTLRRTQVAGILEGYYRRASGLFKERGMNDKVQPALARADAFHAYQTGKSPLPAYPTTESASTKTPLQQPTPSSQTTQSSQLSPNTILLYFIVLSAVVGFIWYAVNTPSLALGALQSTIMIATTTSAVVVAFYGYEAIQGAFILITVVIAGIPWWLLCSGWHDPDKFRRRDESLDLLRVLFGMVPPLLLLYILSRAFSTQVSYCIVSGVSSMMFWFLKGQRGNILRAEKAAAKDAEERKSILSNMLPFTQPPNSANTSFPPVVT